MKLKTVRVRRSRPSTLSLALALMITMLCVYLGTLASLPEPAADTASSEATSGSEVRMEGMDVIFECEGRYDTLMEAQVISAYCAQSGGAGLVLDENGQYAVVRNTAKTPGENSISRSARGLTLKLTGTTDEIASISDAAAFLYAQASETGSLAQNLENGDTDEESIAALMRIYITRGRKIQTALNSVESNDEVIQLLRQNIKAALSRLKAAENAPDTGKLRLVHAAACADWIDMLNWLTEKGDA